MFSTDAIVLKKTLIRDNKGLCDLFTRDFWKISTWITESKTKTPIDIGGIVQVQIKVQGTNNTLQSYKIKRSVHYETLSFSEIHNILSLVALVYKTLPDGMPNVTLYEDYLKLLPYLESAGRNEIATEFFKLKLTKYLGILLPQELHHEVKKIHSALDRVSLPKLCEEMEVETVFLSQVRSHTEKSLTHYLW